MYISDTDTWTQYCFWPLDECIYDDDDDGYDIDDNNNNSDDDDDDDDGNDDDDDGQPVDEEGGKPQERAGALPRVCSKVPEIGVIFFCVVIFLLQGGWNTST